MPHTPPALTLDERNAIQHAFRHPRGRYVVRRASQLSGIPERTIYDWAREGVLTPDFAGGTPKQWSYRDLVYLRLLGWLRAKGMSRPAAAEHVASLRQALCQPDVDITAVRTDGIIVLLDDEDVDRRTGQTVLKPLSDFLDVFEMLDPIDELGGQRLWGPSLVHPSPHTFISPWVMGGEPCAESTRIPTSTIYALVTDRGLGVVEIVQLYPGLEAVAVEDAVGLERRLRGGVRAAA
jgi:uncharacterized protein (DUF433 family)/DNA-binding transcriptional MerR regulator